MCGLIALAQPGFVAPDAVLEAMVGDIRHRGPDAQATLAEQGWGLGFARLSIMDPQPRSDQPMTDATGRVTLAFNGEIYNCMALRAELEAIGRRFRTTSDSEVLLEGYCAWGVDVVEKLEGMFAFALIDRAENALWLCRDPFGIKPLYLTRNSDGLWAAASEVRPLGRITPLSPDPRALGELALYGFAGAPLSNYEGVERLTPGGVVRIDLATGARTDRVVNATRDTLATGAPATTVDDARQAIEASLKAHLMSDVGYALQLSGGVDSSLIAALAATSAATPLDSYAVDLGAYAFDEKPWRRPVVDRYGLRHHEEPIDGAAFAAALPRAIRHMEGPVPHGGCVTLLRLSDRIAERHKVVLTGEGADEFFAGYDRYGGWRRLALQSALAQRPGVDRLPRRPPFLGLRQLRGGPPAALASVYDDVEALAALFRPVFPPAAGAREAAAQGWGRFLHRMLAVDQSVYLESLLLRQDKMSMAASLEARVPFVHRPLAQVANRLPDRVRAPGGETKPVLKQIAEAYLPRDVVRRRKVGLRLPYDEWVADDAVLGDMREALREPNAPIRSITDSPALSAAAEAARRPGGKGVGFRLINLDLWMRSVGEADAAGRVGATLRRAH